MIGLRPVIDRYSEAIQWDLRHLLQIDLLDYFRGDRSWLELGRFLRELRHHENSHFMVAQMNDPEMARRIWEEQQRREKRTGKRRSPWRPSAYEWGVVPTLLTVIIDRLGELLAVEASQPLPQKAKRLKPPKPFPGPSSAMERVEWEARLAYFESLDAEVQEAQERYRQEHGGQTT